MASAKRTTKVLRTPRDRTVAYARKQKPPTDGGAGQAGASDDDAPEAAAISPDDKTAATTATTAPELASSEATAKPGSAAAAAPATAATAEALAEVIPPPSVEPWPDATPRPMTPVDPARARTSTVRMPVQASIGTPPAMPIDVAPVLAPVDVGSVENPTRMPGPREVPGGTPDDPASPPGYVPRGDSRSMRRRTDRYEFALVYRIQTYVISRSGVVGTRGQWRVVEYPTSASASHAYAKECSRFVSEGFSDYRE
jgi:hypothetical protein